jgi:hypothetical protein
MGRRDVVVVLRGTCTILECAENYVFRVSPSSSSCSAAPAPSSSVRRTSAPASSWRPPLVTTTARRWNAGCGTFYKSSAGAHAPSLSEVIVSKIHRLDSHVCCLGWRCPFPVPPARRRHSMLPRFGIIHPPRLRLPRVALPVPRQRQAKHPQAAGELGRQRQVALHQQGQGRRLAPAGSKLMPTNNTVVDVGWLLSLPAAMGDLSGLSPR